MRQIFFLGENLKDEHLLRKNFYIIAALRFISDIISVTLCDANAVRFPIESILFVLR